MLKQYTESSNSLKNCGSLLLLTMFDSRDLFYKTKYTGHEHDGSTDCLSWSSKFSFHLSNCLSWSSKFSFHLSKRPGLHKFWFVGYNFLIFFFTCSEKSAENLFWLQCLMVNLKCWKVAFLDNNQSYQSNFILNWTKPKSK